MMRLKIILLLLIGTFASCKGQTNNSIKFGNFNLDSLVNKELQKKNIPSLAIGIVFDGKVVFSKAYGLANVEDGIPATEFTVYQIGSVTKVFTGHLLAQLIGEKSLSLSDPLADFFPSNLGFPKSSTGQLVSVKDMATHTSEFPRYPANLNRIDPDPIRGYSKEEMLIGIEMVTIDTVIGTKYNYSNFGYGILGVAMESLLGKELSVLMHENIFSKYGMSNSSLVYSNDIEVNLAVPYLEVSPYKRTEPWDMGTLSGAGNIFSTISDLNKFIIELMKDNEINSIQQTKHFKINETWHYGLGCFIIDSKSRNTPIIYHGGDIDGYASSFTIYPEHNFGIVILTNWGEGRIIGDVFTKLNEEITDHYLGKE